MKFDKSVRWSSDKNLELKRERGISFDEVLSVVETVGVLQTIDHPNQERYAHQRMWIVNVKNYAYLVPHVVTDEEIFLKKIIPSRKATKQFQLEKSQ
jgi:uncharacterized DUF497 family protein